MTDYSYQLYSSRNFNPLSETLSMLAGHGYKMVEGYGALFDGVDHATKLAADLKSNGLHMASAHMALDALENNPEEALEIARALGIQAIIVPYIMPDDRPKDAAGWAAYGKRLNAAGKAVVDAGLTFGYHNHDFEFTALEGTDEVPMALILDNAPLATWEIDTAWVVKGGHDVVTWINRYSDRISAAHLKDIAPAGECTDEDGWADVGHGTMDWAPIRAALNNSSVKLYVMEHDNPKDHDRFARRSIAAALAM